MPDLERNVGGLRCRDVLERLSDYVDGDLPEVEVERVHAHLKGCDACARFGGEFSRFVAGLRESLLADEPVEPDLHRRIMAGVREAPAEG